MPTQAVAMTRLPLNVIHPNPDQPRKDFNLEEMESLKSSLQERGLINPISVVQLKENDYMIIAGERRFKAAGELGWDQIDCRIWPSGMSAEEIDILSLVENLHRKDLNPIEIANGYKRLTEAPYSWTHDQIAKAMGMNNNVSVSRYLALLDMPKEIQDLLPRGSISETHCRIIRQIADKDQQIGFAKKVADEGWGVRETERQAKQLLPKKDDGAKPDQKTPPADPLARLWQKLDKAKFRTGQWKASYSKEGQWDFHFRPNPDYPMDSLSSIFLELSTEISKFTMK